MRRVIFNQKGGVGKSSITVNLAAISAEQERRTLVVDLDAQCNTSQYLLGREGFSVSGFRPNEQESGAEEGASVADFFEQFLSFHLRSEDPQAFVRATPYERLDILPASPRLGELQNRLAAKHKIYKLREGLEQLSERYDAIYIDTPPAFNFYTLSALIAAEACLIPFDCDEFSRRALYTLLGNVQETRQDHNAALAVEGIVVNQFMEQANLPQRIVAQLEEEDLPVLRTRLMASVKMRESHERAVPLIYFAPRHKLTRQFVSLFHELESG